MLFHNGIESLIESMSSMKRRPFFNNEDCRKYDKNIPECRLLKLDETRYLELSAIFAMETCLSPATEKLYLNDTKLLTHNWIMSLMKSVSSIKGLKSKVMKPIYCRVHNKMNVFWVKAGWALLNCLTYLPWRCVWAQPPRSSILMPLNC